MKGKNLVILIVLAVVLVAAAVLMSKKQAAPSPASIGKPVLAGLPVNDIRKIVISSDQGTSTVVRIDDTWCVANDYNYPADFARVRDLLLKLSDL